MNGYTPDRFEATLSRRWAVADGYLFERYAEDGGYEGLRKVLTLDPDEVIDTVKRGHLRGRGGAS